MAAYFVIYLILFICALTSGSKGIDPSVRPCNVDDAYNDIVKGHKKLHLFGIISLIATVPPAFDFICHLVNSTSPIFNADYSEGGPMSCVMFSGLCILGWCIYFFSDSFDSTRIKEKIKEIAEKNRMLDEESIAMNKAIAAKKKELEDEREVRKNEIINQYGKVEKIFYFGNNFENSLINFPESSIIYYNGKTFPYDCIIGAEMKDDSYTKKTGSIESVTTSKTGNAVGRAIVGGMIAGPAGAIIGGTTGKTETVSIDKTSNEIIHHYRVLINFCDENATTLHLDCENLLSKAEKITSMINGIAEREKRKRNSTQVSSTVSIADELEKFARLRDQGIITEQEFIDQKTKLLNQ